MRAATFVAVADGRPAERFGGLASALDRAAALAVLARGRARVERCYERGSVVVATAESRDGRIVVRLRGRA